MIRTKHLGQLGGKVLQTLDRASARALKGLHLRSREKVRGAGIK